MAVKKGSGDPKQVKKTQKAAGISPRKAAEPGGFKKIDAKEERRMKNEKATEDLKKRLGSDPETKRRLEQQAKTDANAKARQAKKGK